MFYSLFLYGIIYWIFKIIPVRNNGEGLEWHEYVRNWGDLSMRTCAYDGRRASNFFHFGAYVQIE